MVPSLPLGLPNRLKIVSCHARYLLSIQILLTRFISSIANHVCVSHAVIFCFSSLWQHVSACCMQLVPCFSPIRKACSKPHHPLRAPRPDGAAAAPPRGPRPLRPPRPRARPRGTTAGGAACPAASTTSPAKGYRQGVFRKLPPLCTQSIICAVGHLQFPR